jgi:DnaJ-class molecular chaperone
MQEPCLICEGTGRLAAEACPYCAGSGRVKVVATGPQTILLATGSCKMPLRRVTVDGGLKIHRQFTAPANP